MILSRGRDGMGALFAGQLRQRVMLRPRFLFFALVRVSCVNEEE